MVKKKGDDGDKDNNVDEEAGELRIVAEEVAVEEKADR